MTNGRLSGAGREIRKMSDPLELENTALMHGGSLEFVVPDDEEETYELWETVTLRFLTSKPTNDDLHGNEEVQDDLDAMMDTLRIAAESFVKPGWKIEIEAVTPPTRRGCGPGQEIETMKKTGLRAAKLMPAAFYVCCPDCGEEIANPKDGCLMWEEEHIVPAAVDGQRLTCACGTQLYFTRPKMIESGLPR